MARPVGYRVAATEVPAAIERLLRAYLDDRRAGESFREFAARHTDEELRALPGRRSRRGRGARRAGRDRPPAGVDG